MHERGQHLSRRAERERALRERSEELIDREHRLDSAADAHAAAERAAACDAVLEEAAAASGLRATWEREGARWEDRRQSFGATSSSAATPSAAGASRPRMQTAAMPTAIPALDRGGAFQRVRRPPPPLPPASARPTVDELERILTEALDELSMGA